MVWGNTKQGIVVRKFVSEGRQETTHSRCNWLGPLPEESLKHASGLLSKSNPDGSSDWHDIGREIDTGNASSRKDVKKSCDLDHGRYARHAGARAGCSLTSLPVAS